MASAEDDRIMADVEGGDAYGTMGSTVTGAIGTESKLLPSGDTEYLAELSPDVVDAMTYSLPWLKTWGVLWAINYTVWHSLQFWKLFGQLMLVATVVGLSAYNLMPDPELLDTTKFGNVVTVLTLFVSLMLSFFLSASVNRWMSSVDGFEDLFNSIRGMAFQFHALGANRGRADTCLRYAVLSAHFLVFDLTMHKLPVERKKWATIQMWRKYMNDRTEQQKYSIIYREEKEMLEVFDGDKSSQMWLWISSLIGRMAEDGDIPPMASPTYGRVMMLAQNAQEGLRSVKTAVVIQMPFVYVHLLAVLVHVTCILQAINLGLSMGVTYHSIKKSSNHYGGTADGLTDSQITPLTTNIQTVIVDGLKGILGPLLYQAFFDIGVAISSPFSAPEAGFPVDRLIDNMEKELDNFNILADKPPFWSPPAFNRHPHPAPGPAPVKAAA